VLKKSGDIIMRTRKQNPSNKLGFSLIEALITLGIIAILVSLLVPALHMARDMALKVKQQAQFTGIGTVLEAFASDSGYNDYPPSNNNFYVSGNNYTGAQKLAEALIGKDGFGWHPDSIFDTDGYSAGGIPLYYPKDYPGFYPDQDAIDDNLQMRTGPYLEIEKAGAVQLKDIYGSLSLFDDYNFVLTDVFGTVKHNTSGNKIGMPILYYRANTAGTVHDGGSYAPGTPADDHPDYYYEFLDNAAISYLGHPNGMEHPEFENWPDWFWGWFYDNTTNPNITFPPRPYNAQSFILQAAGPDGIYYTPDDVFNFDIGGN